MALSTLVKISGVNNLSDARFCAGMGASILGFCPEDDDPDFVDPKKFSEITGWIQGVKIAGEFHHSNADKIREATKLYAFDYLQVSDPALPEEILDLQKPLLFCIDLAKVNPDNRLPGIFELLKDRILYFIIEGTGIKPEWLEIIHRWSEKYPLIFGAGVNRENANTIVSRYHYRGLSLKGGTEIKPGYYDFGDLADILELLDTGE